MRLGRGTRYSRLLVLAVFYGLAARLVLFSFLMPPGIESNDRARFVDLIEGRAHRPFAYRALVPVSVRWLAEHSPALLRDPVTRLAATSDEATLLKWDRQHLYEYVVACGIMFACWMAFAFTFRALINTLYDLPALVGDLAPVIALLVLPIHFTYCNYIYDPCTLMLAAGCLWLIATQRTVAFYACFALSALNKETAVLFVPVFLAFRWGRQSWGALAIHAVALTALWAAVKVGVDLAYRDNPGVLAEFQLVRNLRLFSNPLLMLRFCGVMGAYALLIGAGWSAGPAFLRRTLLLIIIPQLILGLFLGYIDELRVYYEALPAALLLAVPAVYRWTVGALADARSEVTPAHRSW